MNLEVLYLFLVLLTPLTLHFYVKILEKRMDAEIAIEEAFISTNREE